MKNLPNGQFLLEPRGGSLKRDSGTTGVGIKRLNVVIRDGQRVEIYRLTFTFEGKRGSLTTRERNEWVDTGGPMSAWVRGESGGTGQYAGITGGGRSAAAGLNRGKGAWYASQEGFVTAP